MNYHAAIRSLQVQSEKAKISDFPKVPENMEPRFRQFRHWSSLVHGARIERLNSSSSSRQVPNTVFNIC
jgi:hypothetical protein